MSNLEWHRRSLERPYRQGGCPISASLYPSLTRIGPLTRCLSTTSRKKPFMEREKPLCEKAVCRSDMVFTLSVVEPEAAEVTTRPPKLWPMRWTDLRSTESSTLEDDGFR